MREVVARVEALTIDNLDSSKGYVMVGNKGKYIIARDTFGKFIWVRLTPAKTTAKAVQAFNTLKEAVANKLNAGYKVFEYTTASVQ